MDADKRVKEFVSILLITKKIDQSPSGGRQLLCKLNYDLLNDIYGEQFIFFELDPPSIRGLKSIIGAFKGHIDGLSPTSISAALFKIRVHKIDEVFVDGSNLGEVVRAIKKEFPQLQVCTFFHNVESRFFLGALRQSNTPQALAVLIANYLAERKSVRYSDKIICLNERDSQLLKQVYGRAGTHISPMSLEDKLPSEKRLARREHGEKFAMFVGGVFYANRAGIAWYVKNVVPHISIKTCIVGRGFEKFKDELEVEGKVEVIGEVESLAQWYRDAQFVIAPIFDGSGMKTKVAEALMFGKKIIGTPEAFTGYEDIADMAGAVCTTAEEFVATINSADELVKSDFDPELRKIYEQNYSYAAARKRLESILSSPVSQ